MIRGLTFKEYTIILPNGNSIYTYNARGLLARETNARARDTKYTYDALGRILEKKDDIGTIRYTYDENGNILTKKIFVILCTIK